MLYTNIHIWFTVNNTFTEQEIIGLTIITIFEKLNF